MIKLVSKPILLSILSIYLKTIKRIGAGPKRKSSPPFCLFTVIRQNPLVSVSWIIWCCHMADQFVLRYVRYCSHPHSKPCWHGPFYFILYCTNNDYAGGKSSLASHYWSPEGGCKGAKPWRLAAKAKGPECSAKARETCLIWRVLQ